VVLGCTHYPFVIPLIQEIAGPGVRVIDPAPAVARQTGRVLAEHGWLAADTAEPAPVRFYTSGDPTVTAALLPKLYGQSAPVYAAAWDDLTLSAQE